MATQICTRCKVNLPQDKFKLKRCGNYQNRCIECNDKYKKYETTRRVILRKCDKCDKSYQRPSALLKHIKAVHDKIKDIECPHCDYKFSTRDALSRHIKAIHDKIKDFECPHDGCDYMCGRKSHLLQHIKAVHDKIKDIECPRCDYKTDRIEHLKHHSKTCTGKSNLSSGEFKLQKILTEMQIPFSKGSHILRNPTTHNLLQWDIFIEHEGKLLFIEYDGRQHFKSVSNWGGEDALEGVQYRDKLKNDFCEEHGYPLLRIPYTEYENMEALVASFMREHINWGEG